MGAKLSGVNELLAKLKEIRGTVVSIKPDVVNEMDNVASLAKQKCPVDTTKLQNAIEVRDRSTSDTVIIDMGIFADKSINYAIYVEFGTGIYAENGQGKKERWRYPIIVDGDMVECRWTNGNHPQPYIRPAWDEEKENVVDGVKQAIVRELQHL